MATRNSNLAYDLSAYEPQQKRQQKPQLEVVQKRSAKRTWSSAFTARSLGSFAVVVTLVCLMVYNQVYLNEITGEINELERAITELDSEYVKISSELEAMISLRTVAERAKNELGMDRVDKYQIEYVYLYEGDTINITEYAPEPNLGDKARLAVRSFIDGLMEYIG